MTIETVALKPKIIVNGFPKSGTHLAIRIAAHLAQRQEPKHWIGTFAGHSWAREWIPWPAVKPIMDGQPEGTWMIGHMGHDQSIVDALNDNDQSMLFVYRDLRDVAVSQTYHIENADGIKAHHPGKDLYMMLEDHQTRIRAVLMGLGPWPGLFERWDSYKAWMHESDVLPVRFEDMISDPHQVATNVLNYITIRTSGATLPIIYQDNFANAVEISIKTMLDKDAPGIRSGQIGDWRFEFSDETKELFNKLAGNRLEEMCYEQ